MTNVYFTAILVILIAVFYIRDSGVFGRSQTKEAAGVVSSDTSVSSSRHPNAGAGSQSHSHPLTRAPPDVADVLQSLGNPNYSKQNPVLKVLFCTS
jgi:hypothetical protein